MYIFLLKFKALLEEILWKVKNGFIYIIKLLLNVLIILLEQIKNLVWKLIKLVLGITNIGFLIGLFLLYLNIKESFGGVNFFQTKYFNTMSFLCGIHIVLIIFYVILKPKEIEM